MNLTTFLELFLLLVYVSLDGTYYGYTFFYNYNSSYIRQIHPYSESLLYTATMFLYLGLVFTNFFIPSLLKTIGLYRVIQLNGLVMVLSMLVMVYGRYILAVYLSYFLAGGAHQLTTYSVVYILTTKYPSNKVKYTGYVFTGSSIAFLFWGLLSKRLVNPDNIRQTETAMTSDGPQPYFPLEVTRNYPFFCFVFGLVNLSVMFLISWLLPLLHKHKSSHNQISPTENELLHNHSDQDDAPNNTEADTFRKAEILKIFSHAPISASKSVWFKRTIDNFYCLGKRRERFLSLDKRHLAPMFELGETSKSVSCKLLGMNHKNILIIY